MKREISNSSNRDRQDEDEWHQFALSQRAALAAKSISFGTVLRPALLRLPFTGLRYQGTGKFRRSLTASNNS